MQSNHGSLECSANNNAKAGGQVASGDELNTHYYASETHVDGGQAPNLDSAPAETLSNKIEDRPEPLATAGAATSATQQYSETPDKREEPPTTASTSVAATAIPAAQEAEEELQKPVVASAPDDSGPTDALASAGKELLQPAGTTNSAPIHHQQTDDHQLLSDAKLTEVGGN